VPWRGGPLRGARGSPQAAAAAISQSRTRRTSSRFSAALGASSE